MEKCNKTLRAAVVLCGCGSMDGSEIQESTLALYSLSKEGVEVDIFAPDAPQREVVDFITGERVEGEKRNQLQESARIARGRVRGLEDLRVSDFDFLVIPGGFGTAKNLFTFAFDGLDFGVDGVFRSVVEGFHSAGKPIGAMCIAPLVLCSIIDGVRITLGADGDLSSSVSERFGCSVVGCGRGECVVDSDNRVVSTPSYMYGDSTISDIGKGADSMVSGLLSLL